MAKEDDLKGVELKVSVDCCDGCKKKVLKALSIKGVLKVEIHSTLPKVTVIGNVDVKTLIKKLSKGGKTAELWPMEAQKPEKEVKNSETRDKEVEVVSVSLKKEAKDSTGKKKSSSQPTKSSNSGDTDRSREGDIIINGDYSNGDKKYTEETNDKGAKETDNTSKTSNYSEINGKTLYPSVVTAIPQMNCMVSPSMMQDMGNVMASQARVYYTAQPYTVPMTYYTANTFSAPPPCCIREHNYYEPPVYHPPPMVQSQSMGLTDYFNDENTLGCYVM